ncbi:hypothetical protein CPC08DRAFT_343434 [Agrocybe pediades]|nr:hypothetical protein CPC08DRAFT_343434 [Agrocybe pediades]
MTSLVLIFKEVQVSTRLSTTKVHLVERAEKVPPRPVQPPIQSRSASSPPPVHRTGASQARAASSPARPRSPGPGFRGNERSSLVNGRGLATRTGFATGKRGYG